MKHDFDSLRHPKAGVPSTQYTYRDAAGNPVVIANRYDKAEGGKFFLPFDVLRGEWKAPEVRPIYNLDKIANVDPATPIIFVEGEKCADALSALGYLTTTTFGGSKADKKSDLSPLSGRNVILWPDFDDPGLCYARRVAGTLYKVYRVYARIIPISYDILFSIYTGENGPTYPKGWDVVDGIADGWRAEHIEKLLSLAEPFDDPPDKPTNSEPINLDSMELWHSPAKEGYATLNVDGHFENLSISSNAFRDFLAFQHYKTEGKMLSQTALEDKRRTLMGEARYGGSEHKVFGRIGEQGRSVYLDLGDKDWKALAIDAAGWQVLERPPVRFRRSGSMGALPIPIPNTGNIELLRPFLNIASETDFKMLVAWLLGYIRGYSNSLLFHTIICTILADVRYKSRDYLAAH